MRRPRRLEEENTKLKKLVAERDLEIELMKEIAAKKWWARPCVAGSWPIFAEEVCRFEERAR